MLQIRNTGNGKPEWNISETQLIIPVIDGGLICNKERDKILTSAVTLNPLEGSHQTLLSNALEHSLIVGLDKNYDTTNYKSDLLIIQNSDLKILQCNTDLKVAHTLSDVELDKNEILWQNPILKDKTPENEKAIFEVRHILNYDEIDLEKINKEINLENLSNGTPAQVMKIDKGVLTEEAVNQEKNNTEFIVSFSPEIDKNKSICISLNNEVSKAVENMKSIVEKKPFQSETHSDLNNLAHSFKLEDNEKNIYNATSQIVSYSDLSPVTLVDFGKPETVKKDELNCKRNQVTKDSNTEAHKWNDSCWERNLPLKKKSKMKRTLMVVSSENQKTLVKENIVTAHEQGKTLIRRNAKQISCPEQQDVDNSDSEPLVNKINKQKKIKLKKIEDKSHPGKKIKGSFTKTNSFDGERTSTKTKSSEIGVTKFNNISELVESLLKCRMINTTVWQTLNSGLKEIKVDILKEMTMKRLGHCSLESSDYSPQLKAFALILYFKQPAAFNYLSQIYKSGWPSLKVIKEWKRRMNTRCRGNFIKVRSDSEDKKI